MPKPSPGTPGRTGRCAKNPPAAPAALQLIDFENLSLGAILTFGEILDAVDQLSCAMTEAIIRALVDRLIAELAESKAVLISATKLLRWLVISPILVR